MIAGRVTPDLEVLVPIRLLGGSGAEREMDVGLDTGFTGYLVLPSEVLTAVDAQRVGSRMTRLGDDSRVPMDACLVTVLWHDEPRKVLALQSEGRSMIGLSLLYGCTVALEVVDGGYVSIQSPLHADNRGA